MAILQAYGFDNYSTLTEFLQEPNWEHISGLTLSTTGGRFGGGRIHFGVVSGSAELGVIMKVPSEPTTVYLGYAFLRINNWNSVDFLVLRANGLEHVRLNANGTTNKIDVFVLGSNQGSFYMSENRWHWFEMKLIVDDAVGEFTIKLDEVVVFSQTGIDTQNGTNSFVDEIIFRGDANPDLVYSIDDVVVHTEADFIGDMRIETLRPDGDGDTNEFTRSGGATNFENVDEGPGPDDDSTFVESLTAAHQDLYTTGDQAETVDTIHAVVVRSRAKKTDAGSRSIRMLSRTSTTTAQGVIEPLLTDYQYYEHVFEVDPDTAVAWTQSGVDGMQIGVENV